MVLITLHSRDGVCAPAAADFQAAEVDFHNCHAERITNEWK